MKATHLKYINKLQWFLEKNNDMIWKGGKGYNSNCFPILSQIQWQFFEGF